MCDCTAHDAACNRCCIRCRSGPSSGADPSCYRVTPQTQTPPSTVATLSTSTGANTMKPGVTEATHAPSTSTQQGESQGTTDDVMQAKSRKIVVTGTVVVVAVVLMIVGVTVCILWRRSQKRARLRRALLTDLTSYPRPVVTYAAAAAATPLVAGRRRTPSSPSESRGKRATGKSPEGKKRKKKRSSSESLMTA